MRRRLLCLSSASTRNGGGAYWGVSRSPYFLTSFRHNSGSRAFGAMKRRMAGFVRCQFSDMAHKPVARQRAQNLLPIMSTCQFPLSRRTISRRTHHSPPSPGRRLRQAIDGHHTGSRDSRQFCGPQRRATRDTGEQYSDEGALGDPAPPSIAVPRSATVSTTDILPGAVHCANR
jgi:hypothetical protein